jgi:hypothetical protein
MLKAVALKGYDVMVDRGSLRSWQPNGSAYSVALIGRIDADWLEAFRVLRAESAGFSRFHLDATTKSIVFTCRLGDEAADVESVLDTVEALVELANLYASSPGPGQAAG